MPIGMIVPLIGELLSLSFKIADIIEKSSEISDEDKEALKAKIKESRDSVTYWNPPGDSN